MSADKQELRLVYVTCKNQDEAIEIGRRVVEKRLAACANVIGGTTSIYRWEGRIEQEAEVAVILKTQQSRVDLLIEEIKSAHSYDVPCVVVLPVLGGNGEYLDWVCGETGSDGSETHPTARRSRRDPGAG